MSNQQQTDADTEVKRISNLRDQSFEDAYSVHDVGEGLVRDRCLDFGLQAFQHGDDKRNEDVYSGTGVDLGVEHVNSQMRAYSESVSNSETDEHRLDEHEHEETVGWIEVKTKQSVEWLGRMNKEDWIEYRGFATYVDEEVFIYFCHVTDVDSGTVATRYFVRVPPMQEEDVAVELPFESKGHELVSVSSTDINQYGEAMGTVDELQWADVIGSFFDELHSSTSESMQ